MPYHLSHLLLKITVILLVACLAVSLCDFRRPTKVTTSCCKSVSKNRVPYTILRFKRQNYLGPCVHAVIFFTEEAGAICAHPGMPWVKRKVEELRKAALQTK
ncbi:C-C motif chemokine 26-like [Protopterus annectens]|uniref:C-C motif chemokine 26-like n=1 Tax=Protopterus annectens TaxID=7888 RepID=UPI001CF94462|nr:C-C motif chemokine 26-like [Protopterus annectens]